MHKDEVTTSSRNDGNTVLGVVLCPDCFGDGIETCHNPDHGFLSGVLGAVYGANESACPCCGHSSDHKMKGKCYTCKGTGQVTKEEYDTYIDEFVDKDDKDVIDEHCLKNYAYIEGQEVLRWVGYLIDLGKEVLYHKRYVYSKRF